MRVLALTTKGSKNVFCSLSRGDIVVVMDSSAPRGSWPVGKILEVFTDKQGHVLSVRLQTKSNVVERPVTKLCFVHEVLIMS